MKKVLILIDNFTPDLGAASFRFESLVKNLISKKIQVKVLCSSPNRIKLKDIEELELKNLEVYRISNNLDIKSGVILKSISYFKFLIKSLKIGLKLSNDVDLIIATTPQLLVGVSGALISFIKKKKLILDIRDLWPDTIIDMKKMSKYNLIYLSLKLLEKVMYMTANLIVYNSPEFKSYLQNKNKNIKLITNGIDKNIIDYFKKYSTKLEPKINYKMMYAGNLGIAQNLTILIDFAIKYKSEIQIILIGKGS
ncbi:MAG: hypothetical protein ACRCZO_13425, partial [Cetobacterium sp.]